ncbi:BTB/POZ domain-containing protein 6-like [Limulus polyphemus]|uniref:BTB/POZ domain-containing protein 6-like n=1 Tax=Limulus polyphemus TaxID=6850 RepID=A0ABM1AZL0_LIMPO|nr:BTB/POZ domain-containing protein 6-like [Limulus polyphemus]
MSPRSNLQPVIDFPTYYNRVAEAPPSAPSFEMMLFNSEEQSDVVFLVGEEPDIWRFPCHLHVLSTMSPVFRSLPIYDFTSSSKVVLTVTDIKPYAFENLLRFLYTKEATFASVEAALHTLYAANKYIVLELSALCFRFLSRNVSEENVLHVFQYMMRNVVTSTHSELTNLQDEVMMKCFYLLDEHAETILKSEDFLSLDETTVYDIVSRDNLQLSSERVVFNALLSWACQECKRQRQELTSENKRRVLGQLLYCVRYLVMTLEEFAQGPAASGVLNEQEVFFIIKHFSGDTSFQFFDQELGKRMSIKRQDRKLPSNSTSSPFPMSSSGFIRISRKDCSKSKKQSVSKKMFRCLGSFIIYVIQLID